MIFYNLILFLYHNAIRLASLWHPKANAWVAGRKGWQTTLAKQMTHISHPVWIHCASLGEFEQGRPLIEKIKEERPEISIVLSFYSPSGFDLQKDYTYADVVTYLPADTPKNARLFLEIIQPQMAIFVKYEFWLNYLNILDQRNIPRYLVAGSFRKEQVFFRWYGGQFRAALAGFTQLFVQTKSDVDLLNPIRIKNVIVAGDPRIDRVAKIAQSPPAIPLVAELAAHGPLLILGSSWPPEEALLIKYLQKNVATSFQIVIAPHDISESHISALAEQLPLPFQQFSQAQKQGLLPDTKILIIDNIGLLSTIYQYGKIAFIGGGFGAGIHNILEPVVFGLPVLMGPNYHKFPEAKTLVAQGAAVEITGLKTFEEQLTALEHRLRYEEAKQRNKAFIDKNRGATARIFQALFK